MVRANAELRRWHDWTDPDFFAGDGAAEKRLLPLFLRQIMPGGRKRTRLTLTGWFLIVVAVGIGWAAYSTASNILFMTLSLLLSSLVLSGILSQINFRKLEWKLRAPRHLRADEVAVAEIWVENRKSVFPTLCIRFCVGTSESEEATYLHLNQELGAGARAKLEWTFVPRARGRCRVRLSGVESQFPFGFLRKTLGAESEETVLVWPARVDYQFQPRGSGWRQRSEAARNRPGPGSDLLNLRPYQRGDAPRTIHWKASARIGKLVVRQFAREGLSGYHLFVEPDPAVWDGEGFERLCRLLGSLAEDLFHAGRLETVQVAGAHPMAVKTIRELHEFFDVLSELEPSAGVRGSHPAARTNLVRLRPEGAKGIAIYVDDERAGETER